VLYIKEVSVHSIVANSAARNNKKNQLCNDWWDNMPRAALTYHNLATQRLFGNLPLKYLLCAWGRKRKQTTRFVYLSGTK
jgi:hypothetical protein